MVDGWGVLEVDCRLVASGLVVKVVVLRMELLMSSSGGRAIFFVGLLVTRWERKVRVELSELLYCAALRCSASLVGAFQRVLAAGR